MERRNGSRTKTRWDLNLVEHLFHFLIPWKDRMMGQTTLCITVRAIRFGDHLKLFKLAFIWIISTLCYLYRIGFTVEVSPEIDVGNSRRRMLAMKYSNSRLLTFTIYCLRTLNPNYRYYLEWAEAWNLHNVSEERLFTSFQGNWMYLSSSRFISNSRASPEQLGSLESLISWRRGLAFWLNPTNISSYLTIPDSLIEEI
mgnify:CR=1 FL=1